MLRTIQLPYNLNRYKKRSRKDEIFSLVGNSGEWYVNSEQSTLKFVTENNAPIKIIHSAESK
jgi:hypothetical protein